MLVARNDYNPGRGSCLGRRLSALFLAAISAGWLLVVNPARSEDAGPDRDIAALRALDAAGVDAWLRRDRAAVLDQLTEEAVIIPHHGLPPRYGRAESARFWFPDGGPPGPLVQYEHDILGVRVIGDVGVIHGRFRLVYDVAAGRVSNEGNYLIVARRVGGVWKLTHMIWNDPPNQVTPRPAS